MYWKIKYDKYNMKIHITPTEDACNKVVYFEFFIDDDDIWLRIKYHNVNVSKYDLCSLEYEETCSILKKIHSTLENMNLQGMILDEAEVKFLLKYPLDIDSIYAKLTDMIEMYNMFTKLQGLYLEYNPAKHPSLETYSILKNKATKKEIIPRQIIEELDIVEVEYAMQLCNTYLDGRKYYIDRKLEIFEKLCNKESRFCFSATYYWAALCYLKSENKRRATELLQKATGKMNVNSYIHDNPFIHLINMYNIALPSENNRNYYLMLQVRPCLLTMLEQQKSLSYGIEKFKPKDVDDCTHLILLFDNVKLLLLYANIEQQKFRVYHIKSNLTSESVYTSFITSKLQVIDHGSFYLSIFGATKQIRDAATAISKLQLKCLILCISSSEKSEMETIYNLLKSTENVCVVQYKDNVKNEILEYFLENLFAKKQHYPCLEKIYLSKYNEPFIISPEGAQNFSTICRKMRSNVKITSFFKNPNDKQRKTSMKINIEDQKSFSDVTIQLK